MSERATKIPLLAAAAKVLIKQPVWKQRIFHLVQNLNDLKASFDSNLNKVVQQVDSFACQN
jgi:hypothetical protein